MPLVAAGDREIYGLAGFDGLEASSASTIACLPMGDGRNTLVDALGADDLLGPFVDIPSKENGLDIEGIAVRGNRVFLGLRGPVLRGWATIVELCVSDDGPGRLELAPVGRAGRAFAKHILDLDGLGIRDLAFEGDALLILAGPTMDLDGPVRLYRWANPLDTTDHTVITHDMLETILDVPYGDGVEHAEGLALLDTGGRRRRVLVIYDSPDASRLHRDGTAIDADVFVLPPR